MRRSAQRLGAHLATRVAVRVAALVAAAVVLSGCASAPRAPTAEASKAEGQGALPLNPADPFEAMNRRIFTFNETLDAAVVKPVAEAWRTVLPGWVRTGVGNVIGNVGDVWSAVNHLLQGKVESGLNMGLRFGANTVFGLGGLLDPASEMGLERQSEDFGQTLGRWGLPRGPYLMLPFLGASTVRDATGRGVDMTAQTAIGPHDDAAQATMTGLDLLNRRAQLLDSTAVLDGVALDRYAFVRDAYLARRLSLVWDGDVPEGAADVPRDLDGPEQVERKPPAAGPSTPAASKPGRQRAVPAQRSMPLTPYPVPAPAAPAAPAPEAAPPKPSADAGSDAVGLAGAVAAVPSVPSRPASAAH